MPEPVSKLVPSTVKSPEFRLSVPVLVKVPPTTAPVPWFVNVPLLSRFPVMFRLSPACVKSPSLSRLPPMSIWSLALKSIMPAVVTFSTDTFAPTVSVRPPLSEDTFPLSFTTRDPMVSSMSRIGPSPSFTSVRSGIITFALEGGTPSGSQLVSLLQS